MAHSIDVRKIQEGDPVAIGRAISIVENDEAGSDSLIAALAGGTGRAYRIGITGPPGAGKSTLANRLASLYRSRGLGVGIIAVDPTSPFSGGALLGDRVRMTDADADGGVFIRSMATRGDLGGLSAKASAAADVLDAAGKDIILLETVGVGQSELDVAGAADTTMVVLVPESGDSIQALKAGLMEIGDVFVLNKADRPGAREAALALETTLHFRQPSGWMPDVLQTVASEGRDINAVLWAIDKHRSYLEGNGLLRQKRRSRIEERVVRLVNETLQRDFWTPERRALLESRLDASGDLHISPYDLVHELIAHGTNR